MEITLSICGSAGRRDDAAKMSKQHFEAACIVATGLMEQLKECNFPITTLVSGGAAFIDHVAVKLFLQKKVPNLRLFLPAKWEMGKYADTGERDPHKNPGGTANYYHKKFLNATGIHSLSDIQVAKSNGAELIDENKNGKPLGFYPRNALVAKSDFILAITFGKGKEVKDGGTADTVKRYLERVRKENIFDKSFHYNLNDGKIYEGCTVPAASEETDHASLRQGLSNSFGGSPQSNIFSIP
jgi:hypothetical protein